MGPRSSRVGGAKASGASPAASGGASGATISVDRNDKRYEAVPNLPHIRLLAGWMWDKYDLASDMANVPKLENIATADNPIQA